MTVAELIEKLQKLPQDARVSTQNGYIIKDVRQYQATSRVVLYTEKKS